MNLSSRPGPYVVPDLGDLYDAVTKQVLKSNLILGEQLGGPVATVLGGKLYDPVVSTQDVIKHGVDASLLTNLRPVEKGEVSCQTVRFKLDEVDKIDFDKLAGSGKYLYPYVVIIPHADVLPKLVVGDDIVVMDPSTFMPVIGTVTQATVDGHAFGLFRFALGNK